MVKKRRQWRMSLKVGPYWKASPREVEAPQRLRAMIMRENVRKAGGTEGCLDAKLLWVATRLEHIGRHAEQDSRK